MKYVQLVLGLLAGLCSIALWVIFVYFNPYSNLNDMTTATTTFIMLCLPGIIAIIASIINQKYLMLIAFFWSLPISLYVMLTPGIFALFIVPCIMYFICFLLKLLSRSKGQNEIMTFSN